jgi:gas vesicle protein
MSNEAGQNFLMGLVVGVVVGIAVGVFNAPRPGVESRQIVKDKFDELGKRIKASQEAKE